MIAEVLHESPRTLSKKQNLKSVLKRSQGHSRVESSVQFEFSERQEEIKFTRPVKQEYSCTEIDRPNLRHRNFVLQSNNSVDEQTIVTEIWQDNKSIDISRHIDEGLTPW
jgi:hypothetical protein